MLTEQDFQLLRERLNAKLAPKFKSTDNKEMAEIISAIQDIAIETSVQAFVEYQKLDSEDSQHDD